MSSGVDYKKIDDQGLHITVDGKERLLEVDNIILCAGQSPLRDLVDGLQDKDKKFIIPTSLIGGAEVAVRAMWTCMHYAHNAGRLSWMPSVRSRRGRRPPWQFEPDR